MKSSTLYLPARDLRHCHYTLGITTMKTIIFFTFVVISLKLVIANPLDITDRNAIKSKCDDKELKEASDNYEECQQMIFTTIDIIILRLYQCTPS